MLRLIIKILLFPISLLLSILHSANAISNITSIFADGTGAYPLSFFAGKPTYGKQLSFIHFENNDEMLDSLLSLVNQMGYDVCIFITRQKQLCLRTILLFRD